MIEMDKQYRVKADGWAPVELWKGDSNYIFGRVGCYPMSWRRNTGSVDEIPHGLQHLRDDLSLMEVLPDVTVRKAVYFDGTHTYCGSGPGDDECPRIGQIDITHNGKEIVRVEVVK